MIRFVLDTDHLTLLQQAHQSVRRKVASVAPNAIGITIISVEEQFRGWLDVIRRYTGSPRQIWAYQGLQETTLFFPNVTILPFDQRAYQQFMSLRQQKIRIGSQDLRIAAITQTIGATLVTRNTRDFMHVPDLPLADWSLEIGD